MPAAIMKAIATIQPAADDSESPNGSFELILSAPTLDRDGDTLASDEWKTPLPDHIVMDIDHGMSVATTAGSGVPHIDEQGLLRVKGTYASTKVGQETRTLVNEKHIRTASVSFMIDKTVKDGKPRRELLNGAFVAVPSNRESVILSSKAFQAIESDHKAAKDDDKDPKKPYGDVDYADPGYLDSEGKPAEDGKGQHRYPIDTAAHVRSAWSYVNQEKNADQYTADQLAKIKDKIKAAAEKFGIEIAEDDDKKSAADVVEVPEQAVEVKAGARNSAADSKYLQAAHDALVLCGANCVTEAAPADGDGASEGANKSVSSLVISRKGFAGSVEDLQSRLQCALDEACGVDNYYGGAYPWIIATYLNDSGDGGSVVYRLGAETLCRAFSDNGTAIALDSVIQVVTVVTTVTAVPDTVDGDPTELPPAAAEASKGVATITTEASGGTTNLPTLSAEIKANGTMGLREFRDALDAIPGLSEPHIIARMPTSHMVEVKSSGSEPGSPESPVEVVVSTPPDSKAAPVQGSADDESAGVEADTETAEDEAQEKGIDPELLLADIYAASIRASNLA